MAEQLGEAVLTVSADTRQLEAGLQRAKQQADQAGQALGQAFANGAQGPASTVRSIQSLQQRLQSLRASYETVQIGSKGFKDLQREIQKTEQELARASQTSNEFGSSLLSALGVGAVLSVGAGIGAFLKGSIQQAIELETISRKLSNALGQDGVGSALEFTRKLSDSLGLNFKILADSFSRFTAAATAANVPLQTQKDLFSAVSKAGQVLGLSNDEINGSFIALQQIASKGTVAMEELRGQLGERLPIALAATAKGLGVSQQELIKLVESGKLTATQFFPALTKGLNELTSSSSGVATTAQTFGELQNAWEKLQASFGENQLPAVAANISLLAEGLSGLAGVIEKLNSLQIPPWLKLLLGNLGPSLVLGPGASIQGIKDAITQPPKKNDPIGPVLTKEIENRLRAQQQGQKDQAANAAAASQRLQDLRLQSEQAALKLAGAEERLGSLQTAPGMNEAERTKLQNRISLNEKIRDVKIQQLQLDRELARPQGAGDGKPDVKGTQTQNLKTIQDLQNKIRLGQVEVATQRIQNQQADAAALRTQQERVRQQGTEQANAAAKLAITRQQTQLEQQALVTGGEVSRTALLRLQQEEAIAAAKRQQQAAQQALNAELSKPKAEQDRVVLDDLLNKQAKANADVRQAYADAGLALVQNARSAADALKSAQQSFNSTARGGFQFLTPGLQQRQLAAARTSIQGAVDRGLIRTGVDISTPDKLFQVASFAESIVPAQKRLEEAIIENTKASQALEKKDWNVYVNSGGGSGSGSSSGGGGGGSWPPPYGTLMGYRNGVPQYSTGLTLSML